MTDTIAFYKQLFAAPHLDPAHPLQGLFKTLLKNKRGFQPHPTVPRPFYWDAKHFGLGSVPYFTQAKPEQQTQILSDLSDFYLNESYFIEKSGFLFNAKMMELSSSVEEKSLYAHFAADEATHLQQIIGCMKNIPTDSYLRNPFLLFLGDVIREGDRESLIFLVQVLLEGFGFAYYSFLAEGCNDEHYRSVIQKILQDEAFHHGSGVVLAQSISRFSDHSRSQTQEMIRRFAQLFQDWPQGVISALEVNLGGLSRDQKRSVLQGLDYEKTTALKLEKVKALVLNHGTQDLLDSMPIEQWFKARSLEACLDELKTGVIV